MDIIIEIGQLIPHTASYVNSLLDNKTLVFPTLKAYSKDECFSKHEI